MKFKINIFVAILVFGCTLGLFVTAPTIYAAPSQELIKKCYDAYNGHGYGANTDKKLDRAAFDKAKCGKSDKGPCTLTNANSRSGFKASCTKPAAATTPTGTPQGDADTTSKGCTGELEGTEFDNTCVIKGTSDPAIKACNSASESQGNACGIVAKYVNPLIQVISAAVGVAVAGAIAYGGILYSTAGADANKVAKAKDLIRNAILSLIAFAFLYAFLQWLVPGGLFSS